MAIGSTIGNQQLQQQMSDLQFQNQQRLLLAQQRGPSASLPNGTHVQCQPGQTLNVTPQGGASCSTPKDVFTPSFPFPGPGLISRPNNPMMGH